jgi:hypothetical protein
LTNGLALTHAQTAVHDAEENQTAARGEAKRALAGAPRR